MDLSLKKKYNNKHAYKCIITHILSIMKKQDIEPKN